MPRLLDAFDRIPETERGVPHESFGGRTPNEALAAGLAAALSKALSIRMSSIESSKVAMEAETRVLETAAGKFKV